MAARGTPLAIVAPLLFVGLAAAFVALYFSKHAQRPPDPSASQPDPRTGQIAACVQAADDAEKAGQWELARKALERALALQPSNATIKGRLDEAMEEEKRAKLMAEAEEAKKSGDAAKEAAKIAEARRIREESDLKGRQAAAELAAAVKRAQAAEKDGCVPLAMETWRQVSVASGKPEMKAWVETHPEVMITEASPEAISKKLAELQAKLDGADLEAQKKRAELVAKEGADAKQESRMTTAVAKYKEAIEIDQRPEWKKALEEAEAFASDSARLLDLGLKAYEKKDWPEAQAQLERALLFNRECAAATKLLPEIRAHSVRTGMLPVPATSLTVNGKAATVKAFYVDPTEVTEARYGDYLRAKGYPVPRAWKEGRPPGDGSSPMMGICAKDAEGYAEWVGKRLPTEAEWEAAAGGGDGRKYPWGNDWVAANANSKSGAPWAAGSHPAGASPCGAMDMAGNAAEWTATTENGKRVAKGGSFLFPETACVLTWRWLDDEDLGYPGFGFRCVADGDEEK
ncbi:MAG: SUMF1/EgtB/PvdO family nonheme iron enzyme [Planctomycetes bacterium]|nr:SUMF1/EgtB/PvdO family nonheme iron enzyme [Planctomycetota bacterium]